ncbi:uncharacterized protein P174DRAFT_450570 [Aspergillus novofumigatus IBT 16806]|uniref:Uncharacterized protein n=1 Tax=Aspergillus novofumigatus (strain IBT 16806) TaxID=1392255 RepID=A0A2I1C7H1_ASPN1|nr:uncharacterized protein P174DRAFT_450570 [Aspergillus novofumigatus IBT 16806]PKX93587.1 hypothetical protein P174DRAFT_450570 [Aspergillus novofumigatus IBT 16806]
MMARTSRHLGCGGPLQTTTTTTMASSLAIVMALPTTRPPPPIPPLTPPPRYAWHQRPGRGQRGHEPGPDKRGSTSSKSSTGSGSGFVAEASGLHVTQATTLRHRSGRSPCRRDSAPVDGWTARRESFCPRPSASNVLLGFLLFFALRRQAHRPDGREGALIAQTCVAMYVAE